MNKKNIIISLIVIILLGITATLIYRSNAFYEVTDSFNFIDSKYYEQTEFNFLYTGSEQTFTATRDGYYQIEAWGASGTDSSNATGGKGAYTSGKIFLNKNDKLYIYIGEHYARTDIEKIDMYNGGGSNNLTPTASAYRYNGGGATDIRLLNGKWNDSNSLRSRIMVAAGGGGSAHYGVPIYGANAGNLIGYSGRHSTYAWDGNTYLSGNVSATQINGGSFNVDSYPVTTESNYGHFGHASSGGGGGYYGAPNYGASSRVYSGFGGSSYISGYAGVNSILETGGTSEQPLHTNETIHYSNKYFLNGIMKSGAEVMPNFTGETMIGNTGHGKSKITYLGDTTPEKTNTTLNNIRYIKDCVNGTSSNAGNYWVEIQAITNGVNVAKSKPVTGSVAQNDLFPYSKITDGDITSSNYSASNIFGLQCVTIDLGQTYNLDEVAVWHYYADGRSSYNNYLSIGSTNTNGTTLLSTVLINNQTVTDTSQGQRFTAWN